MANIGCAAWFWAAAVSTICVFRFVMWLCFFIIESHEVYFCIGYSYMILLPLWPVVGKILETHETKDTKFIK